MTPQIPQKNQEMIDKNKLSFTLLHDAGNTYADKLGLRFTVPSVAKNIYNQFGINSPGGSSDNSGTLVGSSLMWASGRDWARFCQLYLDQGRWNGKQLLPATWGR